MAVGLSRQLLKADGARVDYTIVVGCDWDGVSEAFSGWAVLNRCVHPVTNEFGMQVNCIGRIVDPSVYHCDVELVAGKHNVGYILSMLKSFRRVKNYRAYDDKARLYERIERYKPIDTSYRLTLYQGASVGRLKERVVYTTFALNAL